jgi:hypothetical protein
LLRFIDAKYAVSVCTVRCRDFPVMVARAIVPVQRGSSLGAREQFPGGPPA